MNLRRLIPTTALTILASTTAATQTLAQNQQPPIPMPPPEIRAPGKAGAPGFANPDDVAVDKLLRLLDGMREAVSGAGGDCTAVASALRSYIDSHKGDIDSLQYAAGNAGPATRQKIKEMGEEFGREIATKCPGNEVIAEILKFQSDPASR